MGLRLTAVAGLVLGAMACAGCGNAVGWLGRVTHLGSATPTGDSHAELASDDGKEVFISPEDRQTGPSLGEPIPHNDGPAVREECVRRGLAHQALEISNLHLKAVIRGGHGSPIAMVNNGKHIRQMVRVGDYIGTACWRVEDIRNEYIVLAQPYVDGNGKERSHEVHVGVGESAAENLRAGE